MNDPLKGYQQSAQGGQARRPLRGQRQQQRAQQPGAAPQPQQAPTFAELQQQGRARPAPPQQPMQPLQQPQQPQGPPPMQRVQSPRMNTQAPPQGDTLPPGEGGSPPVASGPPAHFNEHWGQEQEDRATRAGQAYNKFFGSEASNRWKAKRGQSMSNVLPTMLYRAGMGQEDGWLSALEAAGNGDLSLWEDYMNNGGSQYWDDTQKARDPRLAEVIKGFFPGLPDTYDWEGGWAGYPGMGQEQVPPQNQRSVQYGHDGGYVNAPDTQTQGYMADSGEQGVSRLNQPRQNYVNLPNWGPDEFNPVPSTLGGTIADQFTQNGGLPYIPDPNGGWTDNPTYTGGNAPPMGGGQGTQGGGYQSPWNDIYKNWMGGGQSAPNQFNYQGGQLSPEILEAIRGSLSNPNPYNSDLVVGSYERLNNRMSQDFDVQRGRIGEEMARRGVGDSTIHGGRLGDVAIQQSRSQTDLAHQLLEDAARQEQSSSLAAINAAMGWDNQQFGQAATGFGLNQGARDQWFNENRNRQNDALGWDQMQWQRWMQETMLNNDMDQSQIDFWLRMMGL